MNKSHGSESRSAPRVDAIRVVLAIDASYVPWAATMIYSCLRANPGEPLNFHILNDGSVPEVDRARLNSLVGDGPSSVAFIDFAPGVLAELPSDAEIGPIVWLRCHIPELFPDAARALYLDSDIYVAGALRPLWETPLGDAPLGAVANVIEPGMRGHVASLGVDYPGGYFNGGVLLLNLDQMRAEGAADALFRFADEHRASLVWMDQDAFNAVFVGRWMPLHPRWNAQNSYWAWQPWALEVFDEATLHEAMAAPAIRHFEGPSLSKPWHYLCSYPGYREFRVALAETPWAGTPLEDRTLATRMIKKLPRSKQQGAYKRLLGWRITRAG